MLEDRKTILAGRGGGRVALAVAAGAAVIAALAPACSRKDTYDPTAEAMASMGRVDNREASIPPSCYVKTAGGANVCWTCHTVGVGPNALVDSDLQSEYSFSDAAQQNRWQGLFVDRRNAVVMISDEEILAYVRKDNYTPLRAALAARKDYPGYVPDLDFAKGFDEAGFARDGSGFRAVRYKPFPGNFWPTNGSVGDTFLRLPAIFRQDAVGHFSLEVYKANLAILEAAIAAEPSHRDGALDRAVEPVSEEVAGFDLDGDGVMGRAARVQRLPPHYAGLAKDIPVRRYLYPQGTEFLHSVRYLDPDRPDLFATRMKELRYARKVESLDDWAIVRAYEKEAEEKDEGRPPAYRGSPLVGLRNDFGWQLQGFIEDAEGRLRVQTEEEHRFCMGCHAAVGVTVDHTYAFARKVPGAEGFRYQDLRGIPDVPQSGHAEPEALTYMKRAKGADDFRANDEMLARFFPGGQLDEAAVRRAAPGGDRDMAYLVAPSRERALLLDKAYRVLVEQQRFDLGRDALLTPAEGVHRAVENGPTGLEASRRVFLDGRLHLDWRAAEPGRR